MLRHLADSILVQTVAALTNIDAGTGGDTITVGDATLAWSVDEQLAALVAQIDLARTIAAPPPSSESMPPMVRPAMIDRNTAPLAKRGSLEDTTVPERSMPPMQLGRSRIFPLPVAASASL